MGINSRKKGGRGEKQAIAFMQQWTPYEFRRTPGSGGLRGHVADYTVGDIVCVTPNKVFPFTVEVKNYKDINFEHLLLPVNAKIDEFWKQAVKDGKRGKKIPLLLLRYNGLPKNFFFVIMTLRIAKLVFPRKPKKCLIYGKLLITNTDALLDHTFYHPWDTIENRLLKVIKKL